MKKMLLLVAVLGFMSWIYAQEEELEAIRCEKCGATPALLMEEAQQFMDEVAKANEKGDAETAKILVKCAEAKKKIANNMVFIGDEDFSQAVDDFKKLIAMKKEDLDGTASETKKKGCPHCTYGMGFVPAE